MTRPRTAGTALALVTAGISGVAVFLNGYGVKTFESSGSYTTAKNTVAAVVLLAVVGTLSASSPGTAGRILSRPAGPRQWSALALVGVLGGSVPFLLFFEGLSRASSSDAAFVHKTLVVWVALLAVPLLGERVGALQWGAIALLVLGQASLAGGWTTPLRMPWGSGELLVLAATLCWSVETVLVKHLLGDLTSWTVAVARMGLGSLVLLGWSVARGQAGQLVGLDAEQIGWVLLTGALLAAYVGTWFAALARAQAVDVTAVLVVGALVTAVLSALAEGTSLTPQLAGLTLVASGTVLVLVSWRRTPGRVPVT
jgi:drug/metabolite transporter (DMT)-like permease